MINVIDGMIIGLLFIIFAYVASRVINFAHYRTKLEYLREVMKLTKGEK